MSERRYRDRIRSGSPKPEEKSRRSRSPMGLSRRTGNEEKRREDNWTEHRRYDDRRRGNFNRYRGDGGRFDSRVRRPFQTRRFDYKADHHDDNKSPPIQEFSMWRSPTEGQQAVCEREEFKNEFVDSSMLANLENFTVPERKPTTGGSGRHVSLSQRWSIVTSGSDNRKSTKAPDGNRFDESQMRHFDRPARFGYSRGRNNFRRGGFPVFQPVPHINFRPLDSPFRPTLPAQTSVNTTSSADSKEVMQLIDPTQVPKGRSYFEHDSRSDNRGDRGRSFSRGRGFAPNRSRDFDRRIDEPRTFERSRSPRNFSDPSGGNPWKHDKFETLETGETV